MIRASISAPSRTALRQLLADPGRFGPNATLVQRWVGSDQWLIYRDDQGVVRLAVDRVAPPFAGQAQWSAQLFWERDIWWDLDCPALLLRHPAPRERNDVWRRAIQRWHSLQVAVAPTVGLVVPLGTEDVVLERCLGSAGWRAVSLFDGRALQLGHKRLKGHLTDLAGLCRLHRTIPRVLPVAQSVAQSVTESVTESVTQSC